MRIFQFIVVCTVSTLTGCVSTLESAVESGDYDAVKQEIAEGGNVDGNYWTTIKEPMYRAIDNNDLGMIKLLHESGANILPDFLSEAAQAGATNTYSYLLANGTEIDSCQLDVDYPSFWSTFLPSNTMPPLGSAVIRGDLQSIKLLVELGAPVEQDCELSLGRTYQFSAIINAAYYGDPRVIRLLISYGANPNRLVKGDTPLSIASREGHFDAVQALLANGAFHTYSDQIKQPIEHAVESGHEDIADLLVYAGAVRPRTIRPSELFEGVVDAVVTGVVVVGTIYLIAEGSKYADFDPALTTDLSGNNRARSDLLITPDSDESCRWDYDCGAYEICAKRYARSRGVCVRDDLNSGKQSESYGVGPTNRGRDPHSLTGFTCPIDYEYDRVYGGCRR